MLTNKMRNSLVIFIFFLIGFYNHQSKSEQNIYKCPLRYFKLKGMLKCHPWLTCADISTIKILESLGSGEVKNVHLATWGNYYVALSSLKKWQFVDDFQHGLDMLILLNNNRYIVQLVGYCKEKHLIVTEYHPKGNAVNITSIISNSIVKRLKLCLNYAEILNYIHNSPGGTRVFCDSNDLSKLLSQLLITDDWRLVLNDVDALPEVTASANITCGHRELKGPFVAPEQLWKHKTPFITRMMDGYNEKTDIWKAAEVCTHFLKNVKDNEVALYRLFDIHRQCRKQDPSKRPTALELVREYIKVLTELNEHDEL